MCVLDWRRTITVTALALGVSLAYALPGQAQDAGALWSRNGCASCHGNLAAGDGDPAYPAGPNLRRSRLDRAQLVETIACGRPGTEMPVNLKGAYAQVACFGLPLGPQPTEVKGQGAMTAEEVNALTDFLVANVLGKTRITRDNCAAFNGGNRNAPECQQF